MSAGYLVRLGRYSKIVEAESIEAAALEACRTLGSVLDLVRGATYHVSPVEFERAVRIQYENPHAPGDMVRLPNYGRAKIVDEFVSTPASFLFAKDERERDARASDRSLVGAQPEETSETSENSAQVGALRQRAPETREGQS